MPAALAPRPTTCCWRRSGWPSVPGPGGRGWWWTWKATAATTSAPGWTCRARWAGSPACTRSPCRPGPTRPGRCCATPGSTCGGPAHGLGYGLLRYLAGWQPPGTADVSFNYLGGASPGRASTGARPAPDGTAPDRVADGARGPRARLTRVRRRAPVPDRGQRPGHRRPPGPGVELQRPGARRGDGRPVWPTGYPEAVGELIEYCCRPAASDYTPADFPLAGLGGAALDLVQERVPGPIADIYPLTCAAAGHAVPHPAGGRARQVLGPDGAAAATATLDLAALRARLGPGLRPARGAADGRGLGAGPGPGRGGVAVGAAAAGGWWTCPGLADEAQRRAVDGLPGRRRGARAPTSTRRRWPGSRWRASAATGSRCCGATTTCCWTAGAPPIVIGEVLQAYQALAAGQAPQLPARARVPRLRRLAGRAGPGRGAPVLARAAGRGHRRHVPAGRAATGETGRGDGLGAAPGGRAGPGRAATRGATG